LVEDGKITGKGFGESQLERTDLQHIDAKGQRLIPGLIDLHIHGAGGFDMSGRDLVKAQAFLPSQGITAFLPTSYVFPRPLLEQTIIDMAEVIREKGAGAHILGIHMEGPWFSPQKSGMALAEYFYPLTEADIAHYQELAQGQVRMITFAPEEGQALEVIPWLLENEIIPSIGHCNATYDVAMQAIALGASHATHVYNAMRGLHHREPGTVGAVMDSPSVVGELIADGHHIHPAMMRLLIEKKSREQVCIVSDAAFPTGLPDGSYEWGGQQLYVKDGTSTLADGTLASSVMCLNKMLQVLVEQVGVPLHDAIYMASTVPAKHFGLKKGLLEVGWDADIVILGADYMPEMTIINGEVAFQK
jgi:N-acetylglucosamine-6-phosphate deacetylase